MHSLIAVYFSFLLGCVSFANSPTDSDEKEPSLHVLIATTGRASLLRMLKSLEDQLIPSDYLTVIFDGIDIDEVYAKAAKKLKKFSCSTSIDMEPINLGYWGHGIRNKHNELSGDFILHADDDDIYLPGAFSKIRQVVRQDLNALYLFQIVSHPYIISGQPFQLGCISTQNGVIPRFYNSQSVWENYYGGDFAFYVGSHPERSKSHICRPCHLSTQALTRRKNGYYLQILSPFHSSCFSLCPDLIYPVLEVRPSKGFYAIA